MFLRIEVKADAGDLSRSVVVFTQRELVRINGVVKDLDGRRDGIAHAAV